MLFLKKVWGIKIGSNYVQFMQYENGYTLIQTFVSLTCSG